MREQVLYQLTAALEQVPAALAARAYGSSLCNETSVDWDIAVVVPSTDGLVDSQVYVALKEVRHRLSDQFQADIDLVPHTRDEFADIRSPLWYPRYNPSLVFGRTLKGEFPLTAVHDRPDLFSFADLTAYVLLDNRTICRRQLVRELRGETGRIYLSKLLHGTGNALTYQACLNREPFSCSPSNLQESLGYFDIAYGVDSSRATDFFAESKRELTFPTALLLMQWYETLVNLVLKGTQHRLSYQKSCEALAQ